MFPNEILHLIYNYCVGDNPFIKTLLILRCVNKSFKTWLFMHDEHEYVVNISNMDTIKIYHQISHNCRFIISRHNSKILLENELIHSQNIISLYCHKDLSPSTFQNFTNLSILNIGCNNLITNTTLKCFIKLKKLYIGNNNRITDDALQYLLNLEELNLGNNKQITDIGICYVSNLLHLDLGNNNNVTDKSIDILQFLKSINLKFNKIITTTCKNKLRNKSIIVIDF